MCTNHPVGRVFPREIIFSWVRKSSDGRVITGQNFTQYRGQAVAQFVEELRYKPEGRGFDFRCSDWDFSFTQSFRPHYGPGVDSASKRNEYQGYPLGVRRPVRRADNLTHPRNSTSRSRVSKPVLG